MLFKRGREEELLGWSKTSFRFFHKVLWKRPSKLFGHPDILIQYSSERIKEKSTKRAQIWGCFQDLTHTRYSVNKLCPSLYSLPKYTLSTDFYINNLPITYSLAHFFFLSVKCCVFNLLAIDSASSIHKNGLGWKGGEEVEAL